MNRQQLATRRQYHRFYTNVTRLYQQKKIRAYTELVLSVLTISFFLFFAIKPTAVTISGLVKEIEDQRLVAEKLQQKINDLGTARKEYLTIKTDLPLVDQALPPESQTILLARQLEALTRRTAVTINGLSFGQAAIKQVKTEPELQTIDFNLTVTGEYQNLKSFLQSLESLTRMTSMDGFGFQKKSEDLILHLTGQAYYLPKAKIAYE